MKVLFLPEVRFYFRELMDILFEKEYFGFEDSAIQYVRDLVQEIEKELPCKPARPAPRYFDKYVKHMFYASFRKSRQTVWYVFYTKYRLKGETVYLVRFMSNNHLVAQYL